MATEHLHRIDAEWEDYKTKFTARYPNKDILQNEMGAQLAQERGAALERQIQTKRKLDAARRSE